MRRHISVQLWLLCVLVSTPTVMYAAATQEEETLPGPKVIPFSEGGVTFEPYQMGDDPLFDKVIAKQQQADPESAGLDPLWGQFSNSTDMTIVVMTLIGDCIDSSGARRAYTARSDWTINEEPRYRPGFSQRVGFGPLRRSPGRERPAFSIKNLRLPITVGSEVVEHNSEHYEECNPISLELDTVILEDGTVLGKDQSRMVELLRARKKAVDIVSEELLALLDRQRDPTPMLNDYAETDADLRDPVAFWSARVAKILLAATNQLAILAELSTIPQIDFHR